jgi:hypothetical protein
VNQSGIGTSLIWLKSLSNLRGGYEDDLHIIQATSTCLIPSNYSQSEHSNLYNSNYENKKFSEIILSRNGNICNDCDGNWMSSVPDLDGMCGSIPVSGNYIHIYIYVYIYVYT